MVQNPKEEHYLICNCCKNWKTNCILFKFFYKTGQIMIKYLLLKSNEVNGKGSTEQL